jgi:hypothetical protein
VEIDDLAFGAALVSFCAVIVAFVLADLLGRLPAPDRGQHREAEQQADTLLKEWLSPEQISRFESHGYFEVQGSHSSKCYRIRRDRHMNIDELDKDGARVAVWCFGPAGNLPVGDIMLAQKIALETDEQAALVVANRREVAARMSRRHPGLADREAIIGAPIGLCAPPSI